VPLGGGEPGVLAADRDGADAGAELARGQAEQRALAGAVAADQAGDAGAQFEGHLVDADDGAVPLGDAVEEQQRLRVLSTEY
jgi:hypothetical protein